MQRNCDVCGREYEAKRSTSKYCPGSRCRTQASRARQSGGGVVDMPKRTTPRVSVESATTEALEEVGRLESPLGQVAVALAHRLDGGHMDTGAALASLAKQLEATLAAATADAEVAADPIDELRLARERKRAAAG